MRAYRNWLQNLNNWHNYLYVNVENHTFICISLDCFIGDSACVLPQLHQ